MLDWTDKVNDGLTWVQRTMSVDYDDRTAIDAMEANDGWRLLHVGTGVGGQTVLTFGWPWEDDNA